ncbi:MAG: 4-alpha-glucanotransferase [Steroidobacteraceae bacterium]|nr:4-alpha-glucanotransferase [Steroidobacteraceae bacterium]
MREDLIAQLATWRGLGEAYYDYRGELRRFDTATKAAILRAMGVRVDEDAALLAELGALQTADLRALAPPVAASNGAHIGFSINVSAAELGAELLWSVRCEDGAALAGGVSTADCPELWRGELEGSWITRRRFELPPALPPGYHELVLRIAGGAPRSCLLIISPPGCYEPAALGAGLRLWGVAVQLYTVRSRDNWGIGDFADLEAMVRGFAAHGAGFIGLNPLHALASADPDQASPYGASDRRFLNVLYLAVPAVAEFATCAEARARVAEPSFQGRLAALRAAALVDYRGVAAVKFEILRLLHAEFRARHIAVSSARALEFAAFVAAGGIGLERYARFEALDGHLHATQGVPSGWMNWPAPFRDPAGAAVERFAAEHREEVEFFVYLQWLAQTQLSAAQTLAHGLGMPVGLYGDYAVGASAAGAEVWSNPGNFRLGAEIGAPPDPIALKGQGWGIPPQDPAAMRAERFAAFRGVIRENMRRYGALRLDHVMSLFRLWWVPGGGSPADGCYVHYPLHELMMILALESARERCLVVGEDLGVVSDEVREAMTQYGLYRYKVMIFEKDGDRFRRPEEYPQRALATVSTHDMPTIHSYWDGLDIELRERLNLYPDAAMLAQVRAERAADRAALGDALAAVGEPGSGGPFTPALALGMHRYLAGSSAALVAVQIEDLLGMVDPVNVPGTHTEYPNWRRKLDTSLEQIFARADLTEALGAIDRARRR